MKPWLFLSLLILTFSTAAFGADEKPGKDLKGPSSTDERYVAKKKSLDLQRAEMEEALRLRIQKSIEVTVPAKHFIMNAFVDLIPYLPPRTDKIQDRKPADLGKKPEKGTLGAPYLSKLGMDLPWLPENTNALPIDTTPNIYDYIKKVRVSVILDKALQDSKSEVVEEVIRTIVGPLGKESPEVKVEKLELVTSPPPQPPQPPAPVQEEPGWSFRKWLSEFKMPLGLLICTLILAGLVVGFGLRAFKEWIKVEEKRFGLQESHNAWLKAHSEMERERVFNREKQEEKKQAKLEDLQESVKDLPAAYAGLMGIVQFKRLLREQPDVCIKLAKSWLNSKLEIARESLKILSHGLSQGELTILFNELSPEDRTLWKGMITQRATEHDAVTAQQTMQQADMFISCEIVDSTVRPHFLDDRGVKDLLLDLGLDEYVKLADKSKDYGPMLLALLPTDRLNDFYKALPSAKALDFASRSLSLSSEEIEKRSPAFLVAIREFIKGPKPPTFPFVEKAQLMLESASYDQEQQIFRSLAKSGNRKAFEISALKHIPSQSIWNMPEDFLKEYLNPFSTTEKAEVYVLLEENLQPRFLTLVAASVKMKEAMDFEIKQLKSDEIRMKRLEKERSERLTEFYYGIRETIRSNESLVEMSKPVILDWMRTQGGGTGYVRRPTKAA